MNELLACERQVDNLRQASAMVTQAVRHAQNAWQMQQLWSVSNDASTAASPTSGTRSERSADLQDHLEKLTQNIATLSLEQRRLEMHIQDRMRPASADLMAGAALVSLAGQLPDTSASPRIGLGTGHSAAAPLPRSIMSGLATSTDIPDDGGLQKA